MEKPLQDTSPNVHVSDYLHIIMKRKWIVLAFLIIVVAQVTISSFTMTPIYKATAKIIIDREASKSPLTGKDLDYQSYMSEGLTFKTNLELIKCRPVLSKVYEVLNLKDRVGEESSPGMLAEFIGNIKKNLKKVTLIFRGEPSEQAGEHGIIDPVDALDRVAEATLGPKINIEEVRDTRLVLVSVQEEDPAMAQAIANAVCRAYIEYNMDLRLEATQRILSWLADEMGKMKQKLEESEARFLAFKEQEKIFSITGKQKVHSQKIQEINTTYGITRANRVDVGARIAELKKLLASSKIVEFPPAFARNDLLSSLYQQQTLLSIELKKNQMVYKNKHPKIVEITTKLEQIGTRFRTELQKVLLSLRSEYSVLVAREKALQKALAQYEEDALETNKKEARYAILEREVNTNKELHNMMTSKVKESMISKSIEAVNIRLAEPASRPTSPFKPKKARNILLGIIFGLVTGIGFAFFLEYLDQTVRNSDDIKRDFEFPVLSVIQDVSKEKRWT